MPNDEYRCAKFHRKFPLTLSRKQHDSSRVNPVPRTYVRSFEPLPSYDVTNIHPRAHAPGVVSFDLEGEAPLGLSSTLRLGPEGSSGRRLDGWYGVKGPTRDFGRLSQLISAVYPQTSSET